MTKAEDALRAAMKRLISGQALSPDGRLTVANLAREAGVSRATANRVPKVLAEFRDATARRSPRTFAGLRARIRQLESRLEAATRDCDAAGASSHRMAQHIQALTLQLEAQTREIAQLRAQGGTRDGAIVVFRRPAQGRKGDYAS